MKVLVCGSYGAYSLNLISRLEKENSEVYVITGSTRKGQNHHSGVFQEYNFLYSDTMVPTVIKNIQPDVVLFTGAQDSGIVWESESDGSAEFISGFSNVIIAAKNVGVKKFIYLSTLSVFEDNNEEIIKLDTQAVPLSNKNKTIVHCENICNYYHEEDSFDVSVVRMGTVYGSFKNYLISDNIVCSLLSTAIRNNKMDIDENTSHHMIYVSDAVDAVFRIILSKVDYKSLYILPGEKISEQEMAQNISDVMFANGDGKPKISLNTNGIKKEIDYEYSEELGFSVKYEFKEGVEKSYDLPKSSFTKEKSRNKRNQLTGRKLMPFVENILLFVLIQGLSVLIGGNSLTQLINFYLIYVIIIGVTNGATHAMIAVFLSIVGNYWILGSTEGFITIITDYTQYLWALQLLIIGVLVGYMRDKYKRKSTDFEEDNKYLVDELDRIKKINDSNVQAKNIYENRLVNYKDSLAKMHDIVSELDQLEQQAVIFNSIKVIQRIMEADDIAIYMRSGDSDFYRLAAASSSTAKKMGKTIRLNKAADYYDSISKKEIYRNNKMDSNNPMLAGAIYQEDKADVIIMIWHLGFENINLYQSNLLAILCRMIEKPLARAYEYMESIYTDAYIGETKVLKSEAFRRVTQLYEVGQKEGLLEYALLMIDDDSEELANSLENTVRETDFIGKGPDGDMYLILLPNSNIKETQVVINRLAKNEINASIIV